MRNCFKNREVGDNLLLSFILISFCSSMYFNYPAFSTSSFIATKQVSFFPFRIFAEQNIQAPWQIAAVGLPVLHRKKKQIKVQYMYNNQNSCGIILKLKIDLQNILQQGSQRLLKVMNFWYITFTIIIIKVLHSFKLINIQHA